MTKYVLVYMDDILIIRCCSASLDSLVRHLHAQVALKDLGELDYLLCIQVHHVESRFFLSQKKYVVDLLVRVKMQYAKGIASPMTSGEKLTAYGSDSVTDSHLYCSVVGALQYLTITCHGLSFVVNKDCQFMQTPLEAHWKAVKRIFRYIVGTIDYGLHIYRQSLSNISLSGFSDADWASDCDDRKSTTDFYVYLGSNLIAWSLRKQHTISRSSTEAEFDCLANLVSETMWLQFLLGELVHGSLPLAIGVITSTPCKWLLT